MKKAVLIIAFYGICGIAINSCAKKNSSPVSPPCSINGTSVNIGSSTGGSYFILLGNSGISNTYDYLYFDNTDLNFYLYETVNGFNSNGSYLLDAGQQSCLGFSYSGTPATTYVAYKKGEGYAGTFKDGHSVKFITISYNSGVALISYIYN